MDVIPLSIPEVKLVRPRRHGDARGWFSETYRADALADAGVDAVFVQDNRSVSAAMGTLRGLHFQRPPRAQAKLVGVLQGRILDVAVDLRTGSPTYGAHVAEELDAEGGAQLYVPEGFAHAFLTLTPDVIVAYKVTDTYAPAEDGGVHWQDPDLGIPWPIGEGEAVVSDKDRRLPKLSELGPVFLADPLLAAALRMSTPT